MIDHHEYEDWYEACCSKGIYQCQKRLNTLAWKQQVAEVIEHEHNLYVLRFMLKYSRDAAKAGYVDAENEISKQGYELAERNRSKDVSEWSSDFLGRVVRWAMIHDFQMDARDRRARARMRDEAKA